MQSVKRLSLIAIFATLAASAAWAQDLASIEKRVTVKKLDNGLTLIIYERPDVPVFSYATVVNVGSAQEVTGITGLAHMFEHMAFKGSEEIGTTDIVAEKAALAKVEDAYAAYDAERRRETGRDEAKIAAAEKTWKDAIDAAQKYVLPNEFSKVADQAGATGMNAFTAQDETAYFYNLPANRFELWAFLESSRFYKPVFREFYKERDVVMEERRMSYESRPIGRLLDQFVSAAFVAHPYHSVGIGWPSDLRSISATDAAAFFKKYYVPSNMVIAIVGDVKAAEAMPILEKYFGRLPKAPQPEPLRTVEPPQKAERTVILHEQSQPIYIEGYHRPAITDPDNAVYDVMEVILSEGRTSRLYRSLVRDKKIAANAAGGNGFPGNKYPSLFTFFAFTTPGHGAAEVRAAIEEQLTRLKNEDVTPEELQSVKTRVKAQILRQLDSNSGLALQLATVQTLFGDWRELFHIPDRIDKVTAADVRRVAAKTFTAENRTVGYIDNSKPATVTTAGGAK
jgi:predicted Zn-dependent peptidase